MLYMRIIIARVVPLNARPSHPRHHRLQHRIRNVNPPYAFPRLLFIFVHYHARLPDWESMTQPGPTMCKMTVMIFVPLATKILPRTPLSISSPLTNQSALLIIGSFATSSPSGSRATAMESSTPHVRTVRCLRRIRHHHHHLRPRHWPLCSLRP